MRYITREEFNTLKKDLEEFKKLVSALFPKELEVKAPELKKSDNKESV
jgi:hypothetical protein